ncbi:hypothetical protein [Fructobacillus fructosus]|jgi:hypothetical protein|uniref:Uncharacterized protein n=1 Tax=Fructobacillus fructosus TaxID=1631 RepID=A0ABN9YPL2_9LACO|nr:hypothetical protein [Fructobacillus fructosus]MBD9365385.1 hypothetical protein [Leuconostoc mesenteroides]MBC9118721.1 hypothetical protein [Fructobacillus fructosus]MCK8637913.1 hypothetical protein [Fructobacillus fructosus]CAK1231592.1 unnamed protein product [Fructobacillus fructosus]CAK1234885.1 unnamed protein product [Fructobacillus fructosus]
MAKVTINWIDWVKKLSKKQLWAIAIVPALIVVALFIWRLKSGNSEYNANWFAYALTLYYVAAFSPAGEQIQYRLFPKAVPHNQYQVTSWNQWTQAMLVSVVLLIVALLIWPPLNQSEIALHVVGSAVFGFIAMWTWRWSNGIRQQKNNK